MRLRVVWGVGASLAVALSSHSAWAGPTKEECVEAHSKGQDAKESGQLSLASKFFLTCAQASCPPMIQGDCARFSDELERIQPTVSFAARDSNGADLPDTTVYVDGVLTATRLDDGKPHEIDPGRHQVRFLNGGRESTVTVVVNQGEKGRSVLATFQSPNSSAATPSTPTPGASPGPAAEAAPEPKRPVFPLVVAGAGAVILATGITLTVVGVNKVPSNCTMSPRECAAPPGDPAFDQAKSGVNMANLGIGLAAGGLAVVTAGLIWYFSAPKTMETGSLIVPWATANGGGVALTGHL
jgi:hypothetical protein